MVVLGGNDACRGRAQRAQLALGGGAVAGFVRVNPCCQGRVSFATRSIGDKWGTYEGYFVEGRG
jgi:hypothetical protein